MSATPTNPPMSKLRFETPEEAESAFYDSFENGDQEAMMAVWDHADDIVCIHPFGVRLEGVDEVREGWSGILNGDQRLSFRAESGWNFRSGDLAVHTVLEHIRIQGDDTAHTPLIATNTYRRTANGWRMVLHHASPQPKPGEDETEEQAGNASSDTAERILH